MCVSYTNTLCIDCATLCDASSRRDNASGKIYYADSHNKIIVHAASKDRDCGRLDDV